MAPIDEDAMARLLARLPNLEASERHEIQSKLQWVAQLYFNEVAQNRVPGHSRNASPNATYGSVGPSGQLLTRAQVNKALEMLVRACTRMQAALARCHLSAAGQLGDIPASVESPRIGLIVHLASALRCLRRAARKKPFWIEVAGQPDLPMPTSRDRDRLLNAADRLCSTLLALDWKTDEELIDWLPWVPIVPIKTIADLERTLNVVTRAASAALEERRRRRGPEPRPGVEEAVAQLVAVWEIATQKPATHSRSIKTHRDGLPHSDAGLFMVEFFAAIHPTLPKTAISSASERLIAERNRRGRLDAKKRANSRIATRRT